jgi:hypothetical protein
MNMSLADSQGGEYTTKHNGMRLRVKQSECHWAIAPVLDECRAIGKPGLARLAPNG